jgi:hypothetical protein
MVRNATMPADPWTHRAYFKRFCLNVEQYGEILVAQVFRGSKKGDAQPCYDVETSDQNVRDGLLASGAPRAAVESCLSGLTDNTVRIEVKCKLAHTWASKASVIHCSDKKIKGKGHHLAATHFAVVLFDGEGNGTAGQAWFFSAGLADQLRRKDTKSGYIPVSALRNAARIGTDRLIDISSLINDAASSALSIGG